MSTTPKSKKKASATTTPTKKSKYLVKAKSGGNTVEVNKRAIDSAKTKSGAFKPMKYKAKAFKDKLGSTYAIKTQDGTVKKATNAREGRKLDTELAYGRKKFVSDSTSHANTTKRFAAAKKKTNK